MGPGGRWLGLDEEGPALEGGGVDGLRGMARPGSGGTGVVGLVSAWVEVAGVRRGGFGKAWTRSESRIQERSSSQKRMPQQLGHARECRLRHLAKREGMPPEASGRQRRSVLAGVSRGRGGAVEAGVSGGQRRSVLAGVSGGQRRSGLARVSGGERRKGAGWPIRQAEEEQLYCRIWPSPGGSPESGQDWLERAPFRPELGRAGPTADCDCRWRLRLPPAPSPARIGRKGHLSGRNWLPQPAMCEARAQGSAC